MTWLDSALAHPKVDKKFLALPSIGQKEESARFGKHTGIKTLNSVKNYFLSLIVLAYRSPSAMEDSLLNEPIIRVRPHFLSLPDTENSIT